MFKRSATASLTVSALLLILILSPSALAVEPIGPNDLIYFIMTDRFNDAAPNEFYANKKDASGYHGGDFQGIIEKLDYIESLGFTAIWISPVVDNQSGGYHGYWAMDFYKVEEHFGSMDDLKRLVDEAHMRGMKVVFDIVINHTGSLHPYVYDRPDWFHARRLITDWNDLQQVENGWLAGLPDLDQSNPEVMEYLTDMALWWIDQTGVDGYRIDTVKHVQKEYMAEFVRAIKALHPGFYLIGEVFDGNAANIEGYRSTGIDGFLDFPMYYGISDTLAKNGGPEALGKAVVSGSMYSNRNLMGTFIDNHDVPRFVNRLDEPAKKLLQALAVTMTYTGIPVLYYGTEIALPGGYDPDNRKDMVFEENEITRAVRKLTGIRKENPELVYGDIDLIGLGPEGFAYQRTYGGSSTVLLLNLSGDTLDFSFMLPYASAFSSYVDLYDPSVGGAITGGSIKLTAAPRSFYILKLR